MAPRAPLTSAPVEVKLPPEVDAQVRAALEAADRGETIALTAEETERYLTTGELPERVERWAASPD